MRYRSIGLWLGTTVMLAGLVNIDLSARQPKPAQPPKSLRLYVFDCGVINVNRAGTERYKVTPEEVGETRFSCRASWSRIRRAR